MRKLHRLQNKWRDIVFGIVALLVVAADQLSKAWIRANVGPGLVLVDKGFVQIAHVQNTGASFGIFKDHTSIIITAVFIEIILILFIVYFLRKRLPFIDSMLMRAGAGLIIGGAIGNQIDRLRMGYVTDFIDFKVWPAFNFADAAAVVGVIIVVYGIIFQSSLIKHRE
jgi:signal peptidase II